MKNDWKAWFPPRIMENGVDDYESGAVIDLKTTDGGYEAIVLGSREYHVEIEINGEDISGMYCDCAYADDGSFCRHMAAALCEIKEQEEDQAEEEQEPAHVLWLRLSVPCLKLMCVDCWSISPGRMRCCGESCSVNMKISAVIADKRGSAESFAASGKDIQT